MGARDAYVRGVAEERARITQDLHDDVIADMRFETTGRLEAHGIAADWPLAVTGPAGQLIDYATARHLISIVRELTSNIVRHAGASRVSVEILMTADRLALSVSDDGVGVDSAGDWGNGLANCARRAALLDGSFQIRHAKVGTVADLRVKLVRNEAVADKR